MVDKIQKALDKLSPKERVWIKELLEMIKAGDVSMLDVKKLKGHSDIYRVRKGKIRIIYKVTYDSINLIAIERRSDNIYHDL